MEVVGVLHAEPQGRPVAAELAEPQRRRRRDRERPGEQAMQPLPRHPEPGRRVRHRQVERRQHHLAQQRARVDGRDVAVAQAAPLAFPPVPVGMLSRHDSPHYPLGAKVPRARPECWLPKLIRKQERDLANVASPTASGWTHLVIWRCELRAEGSAAIAERVRDFLEDARSV